MEARCRSVGREPFVATFPGAAAAATFWAERALCRSQIQAAESPNPDGEMIQRRSHLGHSVAMSPARVRYLVHLGCTEQVSGLQEGEDVQQLVYAQLRPHRFRSPRPAPLPRASAPRANLRPARLCVPAPGRTHPVNRACASLSQSRTRPPLLGCSSRCAVAPLTRPLPSLGFVSDFTLGSRLCPDPYLF